MVTTIKMDESYYDLIVNASAIAAIGGFFDFSLGYVSNSLRRHTENLIREGMSNGESPSVIAAIAEVTRKPRVSRVGPITWISERYRDNLTRKYALENVLYVRSQ